MKYSSYDGYFMEASMFGIKKKDPVCGMKEEKGKGITKQGHWFCSKECEKKFEKQKKGGCCH